MFNGMQFHSGDEGWCSLPDAVWRLASLSRRERREPLLTQSNTSDLRVKAAMRCMICLRAVLSGCNKSLPIFRKTVVVVGSSHKITICVAIKSLTASRMYTEEWPGTKSPQQ